MRGMRMRKQPSTRKCSGSNKTSETRTIKRLNKGVVDTIEIEAIEIEVVKMEAIRGTERAETRNVNRGTVTGQSARCERRVALPLRKPKSSASISAKALQDSRTQRSKTRGTDPRIQNTTSKRKIKTMPETTEAQVEDEEGLICARSSTQRSTSPRSDAGGAIEIFQTGWRLSTAERPMARVITTQRTSRRTGETAAMIRLDNTQEGAADEDRGAEDAVAGAVVISTGMQEVRKEAVAARIPSIAIVIKTVVKTTVGVNRATEARARLKKTSSK